LLDEETRAAYHVFTAMREGKKIPRKYRETHRKIKVRFTPLFLL
jgi:hypothetical protein